MGTRSRIAIEKQNGAYDSIYCHWDGYPSNNGAILLESYTDPKKVEKLVALGSISSLQPSLEADGPHSFDKPRKGVVIAYHRDRGEDLDIEASEDFGALEDLFEEGWEEYLYVYTLSGKWLYRSSDDPQMRVLSKKVVKENGGGKVVQWPSNKPE